MKFVNREAERRLINEAFHALRNYKRELLRIPIIDFYGIDGIGKTAIVEHVEAECRDQNMPCIRISANTGAADFSRAIIQQAKRYDIDVEEQGEEELLPGSIKVAQRLLARGKAVMLLDAVDTNNSELVERIAATLRSIIDENKLFVVLTSKKGLYFETDRVIARRLVSMQLKPLDQKSCEEYLNTIEGLPLDVELRQRVFEWTGGYPLAMKMMTKIMIEQELDPRKVEDQQEILDYIFQHVIDEKILVHIKQLKLEEWQAALLLLSIPRRFNVVIMQDLIENFEPSLKRNSSLAYMSIPRDLNRDTNLMGWDMLRGGYAIEAPIRHLYLVKNQIERPETYGEIHQFLANLNKKFADTLPGADHIRYAREYLYHSAYVEDAATLHKTLEETVEGITRETPVLFEQFYEEFIQDEELKKLLGKEQTEFVQSLLYRHLAQINKGLAKQANDIERSYYLKEFFYYLVNDPQVDDLSIVIKQQLLDLTVEDPSIFTQQLFRSLIQKEEFNLALGKDAALFASLVQENLAEE